jgi:hypothetical protein
MGPQLKLNFPLIFIGISFFAFSIWVLNKPDACTEALNVIDNYKIEAGPVDSPYVKCLAIEGNSNKDLESVRRACKRIFIKDVCDKRGTWLFKRP